jgi:hypothetical protein
MKFFSPAPSILSLTRADMHVHEFINNLLYLICHLLLYYNYLDVLKFLIK